MAPFPMSDEGARLFDETLRARRRLGKYAAIAVAAVFALRAGAEFASVLRRPDLVLLDAWQSLRGTDKPSSQVVIVAIDEKSIQKFGPPAWPRSQYAPLIERLAGAGARVIAFDFTFGALEREAQNNEVLGQAMKKAGNVVFGFEFTDLGNPSPPSVPTSDAVRGSALARVEAPALPPASGLIEPEPVLASSAAALGHVTTVTSEDGRVRVLPLVIRHGEQSYPSLGLQVARLYTKTSPSDVSLVGDALELGAFHVPVTPSGEVLLDWPAAGEKAFSEYSFLDVVRGDVPDEVFQGKAVFVAGTAAGLDDRAFPFAVRAPGVLLHATFLDNVFRASFVQSPVWAWLLEGVLFLAACALGAWLMPRLSTKALLVGVPATVLLLLAAAAFLYAQKGVWLKVFYPTLALLAPLGLVVASRLTQTERVARDANAEKVEKEKLLGLSFQEKGMLDMALATFNKLPMTDDMKHVLVHLGLDYEHRGQADKAYLVYKKVFDLDPGFEGLAGRLERLSHPSAPTLGGTRAPALPPTIGAAGVAPTMALPVTERRVATELPTTVDASEDMLVRSSPSFPERTASSSPTGSASSTGSSSHPTSPYMGSGPILPGAGFGRYEIERHLGRGGMGDVYVVRDAVLNRRAALKTVRLDTNLAPQEVIETRQRFYREAQTAGRLAHPNIVTVYDVGEELGMSYIVMEFIDGHTLSALMKKERMSLPQCKHVICHAGLGLDFAHQNGVFHRDVKPDNIMISKTGIVKVMDFGIARIVESDLTKTGNVMGTPAYMSPEQVNGEKVDAKSDIFSLGVILYELLTGTKPFTGATVPSLMFSIIQSHPAQPSAIDPRLNAWDAILAKALAKNRDERYATAQEFVDAVRQAPEG
jgi:serine/threonine-protein kinase